MCYTALLYLEVTDTFQDSGSPLWLHAGITGALLKIPMSRYIHTVSMQSEHVRGRIERSIYFKWCQMISDGSQVENHQINFPQVPSLFPV